MQNINTLQSANRRLQVRMSEDDDSLSIPYFDGPIQILPGIWLGSEENARNLIGLTKRGIYSVLNVAREVNPVFDSLPVQTPRPFASAQKSLDASTHYPAHAPSGRPAMHYLKLPWSKGQANLVHEGFVEAMAFVDDALARGDGVLVQYVFILNLPS